MDSIRQQTLEVYPRQAALPRTSIADWAYRETAKRDLRLDLLRGLAVVVMIVDHVSKGSWLYFITGGNAFWVSAAEGFVFISGVVAGMVYGAVAHRDGLKAAVIKLLRRAWTLYTLTVGLSFIFIPFSINFQLPWAKGMSLGNPILFGWNVITLHYGFYLTDVPILYTLLLLAAPLALVLLYHGRTGWVLVGSAALWIAFQYSPKQFELPWSISGYYFHLAAWQLLFFVGMTLGYHREALARKLRRIPRWLYFFVSVVLMFELVIAYVIGGGTFGLINAGVAGPAWMETIFSKTSLTFGRLVADVIAFQFAFLIVTLMWKPIQMGMSWLLVPLGQNSLYSYTMHVLLVGVVGFLVPAQLTTIWSVNMILQLLVILLIWGMTRLRFLFGIVPR